MSPYRHKLPNRAAGVARPSSPPEGAPGRTTVAASDAAASPGAAHPAPGPYFHVAPHAVRSQLSEREYERELALDRSQDERDFPTEEDER